MHQQPFAHCPECGERIVPLKCIVCRGLIFYHRNCPKTAEGNVRITREGRRVHDACLEGRRPRLEKKP